MFHTFQLITIIINMMADLRQGRQMRCNVMTPGTSDIADSTCQIIICVASDAKYCIRSSGMCVWSVVSLHLHPFDAKGCTKILPLQQVKEVQAVGISACQGTLSCW